MDAVSSADGLKLFVRQWLPTGAARGTVQIVHGLGEHSGRYEGVAAALNAAGWRVVAHDLRGHGRSEGPHGGIGGIAGSGSMPADVAAVMDATRQGGPHLLLGHSLGGLIAARFVAEGLVNTPAPWSRAVDGLVLSSPALDTGMSGFQRLLLAIAAPLAPRLALNNGLKPAWISRDAEVVRRYIEDPLVHDRVTPALVRWIVDAGERVRTDAARWRTPTLLLWAGADRCVAPAGSAAFAAAAPAAVVTAQAFPALYHEIFNEPERAEPLAMLTRWLARFAQETHP